MQSRLAGPEVMLDPENLAEVEVWGAEVEALVATYAPGAEVWLGESGNAQCGGAAGISDTWASTFWFLDQLGVLARRGQPLMVRQTLSGSDYGMVDDETLTPRPDYRGALLWRTTMGTGVLSATSSDPMLRVYAHCHPDGGGAVSLLAIDAVSSQEAGRIWLEVQQGSDAEGNPRVRIRCCDTGPGIPEAHRDDLVKPWFTTKPAGQGTGLGLAIAHRLARRSGGAVRLVVDADHTTFEVGLALGWSSPEGCCT